MTLGRAFFDNRHPLRPTTTTTVPPADLIAAATEDLLVAIFIVMGKYRLVWVSHGFNCTTLQG
jgi:hypothetical protein